MPEQINDSIASRSVSSGLASVDPLGMPGNSTANSAASSANNGALAGAPNSRIDYMAVSPAYSTTGVEHGAPYHTQQLQQQQQSQRVGSGGILGAAPQGSASSASSGVSRSSSSATSISNTSATSSYPTSSPYYAAGLSTPPVGLRHFGSGPNSNSSQHPPAGSSPGLMNFSFVPLPQASQTQKRPRRKYEEIERIYHCNYPNCSKAYGTLNHLNAHVTMQKHGERRTPEEFKETRRQWKLKKKYEMEKYQRDRLLQQHQHQQGSGAMQPMEQGADGQLAPYKYPLQPPPMGYVQYPHMYQQPGQASNYYMPSSGGSSLPGYPVNTLPSPYGGPVNHHHGGGSLGNNSLLPPTTSVAPGPVPATLLPHPPAYGNYMLQNGQNDQNGLHGSTAGASSEAVQPYYSSGNSYDQFYKEQG